MIRELLGIFSVGSAVILLLFIPTPLIVVFGLALVGMWGLS